MDFKFNFDEEERIESAKMANHMEDCLSNDILRKCSKHEYNPCDNISPYVDDDFYKITQGRKELFYVKPEVTSLRIQSDHIIPFLQYSDLESGQYEGGLKVWECTIDLLDYLKYCNWSMINEKVLDLGCGSGLLGLYAFLLGAEKVCFQDYNSEVIEHFTIPSVEHTVKNINIDMSKMNDFDFLSGDWSNVNNYLLKSDNNKFDLILSSETIYNVKYYSKIKEMLDNHLSDKGVAFFAAKKHYFGVGGGTYDFTEYLRKNGTFDISVVKTVDDYLPREVLRVRKIKVYH